MSPPADIESRPGKGRDEEAFYGRADRGHPAGGPGGSEDGRAVVPWARDQPADVLRVEAEVWIDGRAGREAAEGAGEGERAAQAAAGRAGRRDRRDEGVHRKKVPGVSERRSLVEL